MERQASQAFLALGANLGDTESTIRAAIEQIRSRVGKVVAVSNLITTTPLNPPGLLSQPEYLNGALLCETMLEPLELMRRLQEIEREFGRNRLKELRWGPRTLDIDIIFIDDLVISSPELTVPHPEMHNREFVLSPLAEIAPNKVHPVLNKTVRELARISHQPSTAVS